MHDSLEQRLKAVENKNACKGLNPNDLNLVSNLVIPPHFQMLRFEKYDETSCPEMHLVMYCNKMTMHAHNEKLLIHIFQESLTGVASEWYLRLKRNQACTWRDLSRAFLEHYKYMLDVAPDRFTLQGMEKKPKESYKEYAIRWKQWHHKSSHLSPTEKSTFILWIPFHLHIMTCWLGMPFSSSEICSMQ